MPFRSEMFLEMIGIFCSGKSRDHQSLRRNQVFFFFFLINFDWSDPERNTFNSDYNDFQQLKPSSHKLRCGYSFLVRYK